jgi:putative flippase GtrA
MEVMHEATASQQWEADVQVRLRLVPAPARNPLIEIVIPVYNEELVLARNIRRLHRYLLESFPFSFIITIADNASTDATLTIARQLAAELAQVRAVHLALKGRGRALRQVWAHSSADVVAYMDVDLSTSLEALLPLVAPLLSGHRDVTIGSRLADGARVVRGPKRELISRTYNLILKLTLHGRFTDAQCGFKAMRRDAAERILPLVEDNQWFFDTEMLVVAERLGLRIGEVAVDWVDDPDSRVHIVSTATDDLRGVWRMLVRRPKNLRVAASAARSATSAGAAGEVTSAQLLRFAGVGLISTLGYLFLFLAWRPLFAAFGANAVAMAIATVFNTSVHKELARGVNGQTHRGRMALVTVLLYMVSLAFTSLGLVVAQWVAPGALLAEVVALTLANAVAAVFRFSVLRAWIFRPGTRSATDMMEVSR